MFIQVNSLSKSFGKVDVLKDIDLSIQAGEQCSLVGPSGSGKSTLLYLLGGMDRPSEGEILIGGESILSLDDEQLALYRNKMVGFVFQFHFLLPSMNNLENILLPVKMSDNGDHKEALDKAHSLAQALGVEDCLKKFPFEISGGEQQRINIIRSVILSPRLLLCDEPTGNLDSKNSEKVIHLMKSLAGQLKATLIVVTHNDSIAASFPRKITIEDGRIIG
jgi:ABC-type lipoprotein export system ATPase subunit